MESAICLCHFSWNILPLHVPLCPCYPSYFWLLLFNFFFLVLWHTFPSTSSLPGAGNSWRNHAWCGTFTLLTHSHSGKWD